MTGASIDTSFDVVLKRPIIDIGAYIRRGIKTVAIDKNGHLILELTDGTFADLGKVVGEDGIGIEDIEQITKSTEDNGVNRIQFKLTNGEEFIITVRNGSKGSDGDPGISPTVSVTETAEGYDITITDEEGEHSFSLKHGKDGVGGSKDAVLYTPMSLEDDKKTQARENIDAQIAPLKITVTDNLANYSSSEIAAHVAKGGDVYLYIDDILYSNDGGTADLWFFKFVTTNVSDELEVTEVEIHVDKTVVFNVSTVKSGATKLSDLENDLFYIKREQFLTLTKDDFEAWENPEGQTEYLYISSPKLDWLKSTEDIYWEFSASAGSEMLTMTPADATDVRIEEIVTDDGESAIDYVGNIPFFIANGSDYKNWDELLSKDEFAIVLPIDITVCNELNLTIYKVITKKIPSEYLDVADIEALLEETTNTANSAQTAADNAQTTAAGKMDADNPVGTGSFSMGRKADTTIGTNSHAEGYNTTASGQYSHAEGYNVFAGGKYSHAEGNDTSAGGEGSHAEGNDTSAGGEGSHAEGNDTSASGNYSHAEGYGTSAIGSYSHVEGKYNYADTAGKYAHIVGNGKGHYNRSNAYTLDWEGNAWYQGDVYVGGTSQDNGSKKLATEEYVTNSIPTIPVNSVNGKTGDVSLTANDVGARSDTWLPSYSDVGAEKSGTADAAVSAHNTGTDAHNDIRLLIAGLTNRLDTLANSDDTTLDQMAEVVAYIKDNRELIEQITTGKVSVSDIIDNLTTNVSNKPLSAAQGVALKALIDGVVSSKMDKVSGGTSGNFITLDADGNAVDSGKGPNSFTPISVLNAVISPHVTDGDIHITAAERTAWNAKSDFSGAYADLSGKPTIPTVPTKLSEFENDAEFIKDADFADRLTKEALVGMSTDITPAEVYSAMLLGKPITIGHVDSTYGNMLFNNFAFSYAAGNAIISSVCFSMGDTIFCVYLVGDTVNNTWSFQAMQLANVADIPTDEHINELIDAKLGVVENGSY